MLEKDERARVLMSKRDMEVGDTGLIVMAVLLAKKTSDPVVARNYVLQKLAQVRGGAQILDGEGIEILVDILENHAADPISEVQRRFGYDRR